MFICSFCTSILLMTGNFLCHAFLSINMITPHYCTTLLLYSGAKFQISSSLYKGVPLIFEVLFLFIVVMPPKRRADIQIIIH